MKGPNLLFARCTLAGVLVTTSLVPRVHAQNASIGGTVMIDPTEKPLANAEILIQALNRSVRTDSTGNFLFSGLPAGRHTFVVRLVGYEPSTTEVNLSATQKFEADFLLKPIVTKLAKAETKGKTTGNFATRLAEFEERQAIGIGKFLTTDYFDENNGRPVSSFLMQRIAGIKLTEIGVAFL